MHRHSLPFTDAVGKDGILAREGEVLDDGRSGGKDGRGIGAGRGSMAVGAMASESSDPKLAGVPERRRHPRRLLPPLSLRIEERKYKTDDWSIGGFRIGAFHREVRPGDMVTGSVVTWGGLRREAFEADVVRLTAEGGISCRFLALPRLVLKIVSGI